MGVVDPVDRLTRSGWRLADDGRLYAPSGAFIARIVDGKIVFFDKANRCETPGFSVADWFELLFGAETENAPAGAWGRRSGR